MLKLEEFIYKRKEEDKFDEFNLKNKDENIKLAINYVLEYFISYIPAQDIDSNTILNNKKVIQYQKELELYDDEVKNWFINNFINHDKKINRYFTSIAKSNRDFYIFDRDSDFRELSYDCYSELVKKLPFIKNNSELLFKSLKEFQRVNNCRYFNNRDLISIPRVDAWINDTFEKYGINLYNYASYWINYFSDYYELWDNKHRLKAPPEREWYCKYMYNYRNSKNLFLIDEIYKDNIHRKFIKGHKQELEILFMHIWLNRIEGDAEYWDEYIQNLGETYQ